MRPVLLVTRPEPDASRTAAHLDALGIEPIIEPMLHARAIDARVPSANGFAALAVTSANAIRFLAAYGDDFKSLPVFCVGGTMGSPRSTTPLAHWPIWHI
jgi:uroporphyrinogen-III synthase